MAEPKFIVSLSNGETLDQTKLMEWEGDEHPWTKVVNYCKSHDLKITRVRMQMNGTTHTSPTLSRKGKFWSTHMREDFLDGQPLVWRGNREMNLNTGEQKHFYRVHFGIDKPCEVIYWLDAETGDSWIQIKGDD